MMSVKAKIGLGLMGGFGLLFSGTTTASAQPEEAVLAVEKSFACQMNDRDDKYFRIFGVIGAVEYENGRPSERAVLFLSAKSERYGGVGFRGVGLFEKDDFYGFVTTTGDGEKLSVTFEIFEGERNGWATIVNQGLGESFDDDASKKADYQVEAVGFCNWAEGPETIRIMDK